MGKLKGRGLPSRLSVGPSRLRRSEPDRGDDAARRSRDWLNTARWQRLRMDVLERDMFTCQQTGVLLTGKYPEPDSAVVDHKIPHRGDPALFWDESNLQSVSKAWHDSVKQGLEKGGKAGSAHPEWLRPSKVPLVIVCGPPASGKSRYVRDRAGPRDLVVDLDDIASGMSGQPLHAWSRTQWLGPALWERNNQLGTLNGGAKGAPRAWFIVGEPKAMWREWWRRKLEPVEIVVLETPFPVCVRNARKDEDRDADLISVAIEDWWSDYSRRDGDSVVNWGDH